MADDIELDISADESASEDVDGLRARLDRLASTLGEVGKQGGRAFLFFSQFDKFGKAAERVFGASLGGRIALFGRVFGVAAGSVGLVVKGVEVLGKQIEKTARGAAGFVTSFKGLAQIGGFLLLERSFLQSGEFIES